jgi:transposase-like protein
VRTARLASPLRSLLLTWVPSKSALWHIETLYKSKVVSVTETCSENGCWSQIRPPTQRCSNLRCWRRQQQQQHGVLPVSPAPQQQQQHSASQLQQPLQQQDMLRSLVIIIMLPIKP